MILIIVTTLICLSVIAGLLWQSYGRMRTWSVSTPVATAANPSGGEPFFAAGLLSDNDPAWWPANANGMGVMRPVKLKAWQQWQIDHMTDRVKSDWKVSADTEWKLFAASTKTSRSGDCKAYARVIELNLRAIGIPGSAMTYGFANLPIGIWHCTLWLFTDQGAYVFSVDERFCLPWRAFAQIDRHIALENEDKPDVRLNGMNYKVLNS